VLEPAEFRIARIVGEQWSRAREHRNLTHAKE
jgi:hypothetical protein